VILRRVEKVISSELRQNEDARTRQRSD